MTIKTKHVSEKGINVEKKKKRINIKIKRVEKEWRMQKDDSDSTVECTVHSKCIGWELADEYACDKGIENNPKILRKTAFT